MNSFVWKCWFYKCNCVNKFENGLASEWSFVWTTTPSIIKTIIEQAFFGFKVHSNSQSFVDTAINRCNTFGMM